MTIERYSWQRLLYSLQILLDESDNGLTHCESHLGSMDDTKFGVESSFLYPGRRGTACHKMISGTKKTTAVPTDLGGFWHAFGAIFDNRPVLTPTN